MKHTILLEEHTIAERVAALAEQINQDYEGRELVVIAVTNGALIFAADLFRKLRTTTYLDTVKASSYKSARRGELTIKESFNISLTGRHVLLLDDILDSSVTLRKIMEHIRTLKPASLRTCVLLDKPAGRTNGFLADYVGFTIPDKYVYGYGMDDEAGLLRNCPYIGAKEE